MNRHVVMICDKCRTIDKTVVSLSFGQVGLPFFAFYLHRFSVLYLVFFQFMVVWWLLHRCHNNILYYICIHICIIDLFCVVGMHRIFKIKVKA